MAQDTNFQNFSTVQSNQQPVPATIASTTSITPLGFITFVSGSVAIATITPPTTGESMICLIFTNASPSAFTTAGNIKAALTTIAQNVPELLFWNPVDNKWYAK